MIEKLFCNGNYYKMKIERGVSIDNLNEFWFESKGMWFIYVFFIVFGYLVILSVFFLKIFMVWILINMFYNFVSL